MSLLTSSVTLAVRNVALIPLKKVLTTDSAAPTIPTSLTDWAVVRLPVGVQVSPFFFRLILIFPFPCFRAIVACWDADPRFGLDLSLVLMPDCGWSGGGGCWWGRGCDSGRDWGWGWGWARQDSTSWTAWLTVYYLPLEVFKLSVWGTWMHK